MIAKLSTTIDQMINFQPLGIQNLNYQIDGSHDVFGGLADSKVKLNSGFTHSSIARYMLTANVVQYQCKQECPVVIDYGCGAGSFKSFWDSNFNDTKKKSIKYIGLEITQEYIDEGRLKGHTIHGYDANNTDIKSIQLPKPDIVLMQQFVEHIDKRAFEYLLDYTLDTLNIDGCLIVSAPNPEFGNKILEHHHDYEYPLAEIIALLAQHGFTIDQQFGWLGFGVPKFEVLSEEEQKIYNKLRYVSDGYANAVMCMINTAFAPYYYLTLRKK